MKKNKSLRGWHHFDVNHFAKVLINRINIKHMTVLKKVKESIKTINGIPNSSLIVESNVCSISNHLHIINATYNGLVLSDKKKDELQRFVTVIFEVYGLKVSKFETLLTENSKTAVLITVVE